VSGESIAQLVRTRLEASSLTEGARRFALAAVAGHPALKQALTSPSAPATATAGSGAGTMLRSVWLRSITVRGFRGVGPASTLAVEPGPGLTLVVGRNGSGKSSFAEGIEIALTGRNERLTGKTADWQKQWRNIHDGTSAEVTVEFQVDGDRRPLTVRRSWTGKNIDDAVSAVAWNGDEQSGLPELGWSTALEQYRPFLSYDDLGKVSAKPSVGFDLLLGVLGLEAITGAQDLLTAARGELAKTVAEPQEALPALLKDLSGIDDDRARRVTRALTSDPPDIADVRDALAEAPGPGGGDSLRTMLTRLASLPAPDAEMVSAASGELRAAATAVQGFKGTDTDEAARLADLLDAALTHHTSHGDGPCPVCGQGTLDASWQQRTADEIGHLRQRAAEAIAARDRLGAALTRARELILPVPAALTGAGPDGIDRAKAASAWSDWAALARENDALALAAGLGRRRPHSKNPPGLSVTGPHTSCGALKMRGGPSARGGRAGWTCTRAQRTPGRVMTTCRLLSPGSRIRLSNCATSGSGRSASTPPGSGPTCGRRATSISGRSPSLAAGAPVGSSTFLSGSTARTAVSRCSATVSCTLWDCRCSSRVAPRRTVHSGSSSSTTPCRQWTPRRSRASHMFSMMRLPTGRSSS
jgi:hypothetical protein